MVAPEQVDALGVDGDPGSHFKFTSGRVLWPALIKPIGLGGDGCLAGLREWAKANEGDEPEDGPQEPFRD